MTIEEIKKAMHGYLDYYGCTLIDKADIDRCKTKAELREIIERHYSHIEDCALDAQNSLDAFKSKIGLNTNQP